MLFVKICWTAFIILYIHTILLHATSPHSPDWDSILANPIIDTIPSPSSSNTDSLKQSPARHDKPKDQNVVQNLTESLPWYAKRPLSRNPRSVYQRNWVEQMRNENTKAYEAYKKRMKENSKARKENATEEEREILRQKNFESQKRFEARKKIAFQDPNNAELKKKFASSRSKANSKYRKKLANDVESGVATPKQIEQYLKRKRKKAENAKKAYHRKKAAKSAVAEDIKTNQKDQ